MEEAGAIQGQGDLCERGDDQVEGEEDQVRGRLETGRGVVDASTTAFCMAGESDLLLDSLLRSTLHAQEVPPGGGTFVAQRDSDTVESAVMLMIPIITVQEDTVKDLGSEIEGIVIIC